LLRKINTAKSTQALVEYTEKMVAALAHEIRNPLNSMKGAAEFLSEKYSGTQEVREFSGIILSEIQRVENYLNEFLSFSRGVKLKLAPVNLKNFITGIIMTVKHGFPYEIEADTDRADIDVEIDPEQIRQVLVNLLANAKAAVAEALPEVPSVRVSAYLRGNKVFLAVKDNGAGMKASVLKNIFVPFYTTREDGMGIGLSVCRAVVQRHRGRIRVKTMPGKGSCFIVELPAKRKKGKNG
jgi:signal transduction histidine kinase